MKKRSQILDKYKWDLTHLVASDQEGLKIIDHLSSQVEKLASYKGKLGNKDNLLEFFELCTQFSKVLQNVEVYFYLKSCEDVSNPTYNKIMGDLQNLSRKISLATAYENSELLSYGDQYINELIADSRFKLHKLDLIELLRNKPHILDEASNKIMAKVSHFAGDFSDIFDKFDAVDIRFDDVVDSKGKKHKLTTSNYSTYIESKDRTLRLSAFKNLYKSFMQMANTIGTNYIGNVKSDVAYANIYNYDSCLQAELFGDNINPEVYQNLLDNVKKYTPLLHKYYKLKKKALGLKDFGYQDSYVTLSKYNPKFTYEQDVEIAYKALAPLGEDYNNLLHQAVQNRWIDVYPNVNKSTGGFCIDSYLCKHPYIMLNNENTLDDMFTFVHECGHAMHSYYSNHNQPYENSHYPIVLAEIASTFNEVLLLKYLYAHASNKNEKLYYLDKYLKMFKSTIFRQTMFSQFEDYAHKCVEQDKTLTVQHLCEYYGNLNKTYHGKAIKHCKEIEHEWLRIPHFYNSYYVYKYATGLISAICLASNVLNGKPQALDKYFEFLSAGGSDYPMETLKKAGVDLATSTPYDVAFAEMEWALKELQKLI